MAFKMNPIGKKKCSYSPMQKKGLINETPVLLEKTPEKTDATTIKIKGKTLTVNPGSGKLQTVTRGGSANVVGYVTNNNPDTFKPA